jgi:hypothetical protein
VIILVDSYDVPFLEILQHWPDKEERRRGIGLLVSLLVTTVGNKAVVDKALFFGDYSVRTFDNDDYPSLSQKTNARTVDLLDNRFSEAFGFYDDEANMLMQLHGWSENQKRVARFHCGGYLAAHDEQSGADMFAFQPYTLTNMLISAGRAENFYPSTSIRFVAGLLQNSFLRTRIEDLLAEV